jgi:hypothetical protein
MEKFLDTFDQPKSNQEYINHQNIFMTKNEIEPVIKSLPTKKSPGLDGFPAEFYQVFKEELTPILPNFFMKLKVKENYQPHSAKSVLHSVQNWTRT